MTALAAIMLVQKDKIPLQTSGGQLQTLWQYFYIDGVPQPLLYGINGINAVTIGINGTYWAFYVNGVLAQSGLAQTKLNAGDIVGLKYQNFHQG